MIKRSKIALFFVFFLLFSCGKTVNDSDKSYFSSLVNNHLLIEKKCAENGQNFEPLTQEIVKKYNQLVESFPNEFFTYVQTTSTYKNPLIINISDMEKRLKAIKEKEINGTYLLADIPLVSKEIYTLYQNSMRFEGQKCAFSWMKLEKRFEVRPYLEMKDLCIDKESSADCEGFNYQNLLKEEKQSVINNVVKMCKAFDPRGANCQAQIEIAKKTKSMPRLIQFYQERFKKEHYNTLFSLKPKHQTFSCSKAPEDVTEMTVKILNRNFDSVYLNHFAQKISSVWSNEKFILKVIIVEEKGSDVVEIIPTNRSVSYVPDNDTRKIYLSRSIDFQTQALVIAHEFGHVLGFPDCYVEFFDNKKKDLIYYELEEGETNIMCTLKNGVNVPASYFQELAQKSCVFNSF